jgi:hypothetical protein
VEISAKELGGMASAVDERHREAMRSFKEETAELHLDVAGANRRGFIKKVSIGGAALAAAPALLPISGLLAPVGAANAALSDTDIAVYAESIELAAVAVYQMAGAALGELRAIGDLFGSHHRDHADAFGSLAGGAATKKANSALVTAVTPMLSAVKSQADALTLAFVIENQAAATYAFALTSLSMPAAIAGTATILPVEAAHAAILGAALGKPVADLFPNGAFESSSVGEAGNAKTGLDPAKYPTG